MNQSSNIIFRWLTGHERPGVLLLSLFTLGVVAVSSTFFIASMVKPYIGIKISLDVKGWSVERVDPNGAAHLVGIREGDIPIEINGQPAEEFLGQYIEAGTVFGYLITEMTTTDTDMNLKSISLKGDSPTGRSLIDITARLCTSLIFWIIGYYVYLRKPRNIAAILLCLCGVVFGLVLSANLAGDRGIPYAIQLAVITAIIGPWLLLHFFLVLPEERNWSRNNPFVYLIYLLPVITLVLFFILGYTNDQPVQWFRTIRFIVNGLGFLLTVGVGIYNYFGSASIRTRQQMKIVLISCLAALIPFLILYLLPEMLWKQRFLPPEIGILLIGFIPLGMGYAVVTQKLMDIDVIIRRGVIYGLVSGAMTIILSAIIFINALYEPLGVPQQIFIVLIIGIIATILFGPIKNGLEFLIDKLFYKDRFDYRQIIQSLSTALNLVKDTNEVSRIVVGTTVRTLNLSGCVLFIKSQSDSWDVSAVQGTFSETSMQEQLLDLIAIRNPRIEFPNSATDACSNLAFLIPLIVVDREIGTLCISSKVSRQAFSSDDLFLLQGLASVAASTLHSTMLVRDVNIRDTFIAVASHELRTPLTVIGGYADMLINRNPPRAKKEQWLKHILDNSRRILDMVDDLLNVSRIQSGKSNLKLDKTEISDVFEEVLSMKNEDTNKHEFVVNIEPDLPEVIVDHDRFNQIVGNLLENAIKYSPDGGHITLSARNDKEHHHIEVSITDEGIGISPEDRDLLFTTFHRIQRSETQGIRGSGLGLYIVKEWTEAMGGRVWLESELNKGSTFFIGIPT